MQQNMKKTINDAQTSKNQTLRIDEFTEIKS